MTITISSSSKLRSGVVLDVILGALARANLDVDTTIDQKDFLPCEKVEEILRDTKAWSPVWVELDTETTPILFVARKGD